MSESSGSSTNIDGELIDELARGMRSKTVTEVSDATGYDLSTVEKHLDRLVDEGRVKRVECGDSCKYGVPSGDRSQTAEDVLHTTLDMDFEDAIYNVQIEHELSGFETVKVTRLDQMIEGMLGEDTERTALIVVCHAEIAYETLEMDPGLAGMLPCTTVVYERPEDDLVHVQHISVTKALRELGFAPEGMEDEVDQLVELTGERVNEVWGNILGFSAENN